MRALLDTVMQALPQVAGRWGREGSSQGGGALQRGGGSGKLARRPSGAVSIPFLFSRWGTWDSSSCYCFSSLQLWAWSSLETWVSRGGEGGGATAGDLGPPGLTQVSLPSPLPECDETHPCEGLGRHATFRNFGMAFLTLFRVSTGDNWNGIMKVRAPCSGVPPGLAQAPRRQPYSLSQDSLARGG